MKKPELCYPFSERTCDRSQCHCRSEKRAAQRDARKATKKKGAKK